MGYVVFILFLMFLYSIHNYFINMGYHLRLYKLSSYPINSVLIQAHSVKICATGLFFHTHDDHDWKRLYLTENDYLVVLFKFIGQYGLSATAIKRFH